MNTPEFTPAEYGEGNNPVIAALITGFNGQIDKSEPAAHSLLKLGHDVVVYEYSTDVLCSGDPDYLPNIVDEIHDDFTQKAAGYTACRFIGFSLGMGIAMNMQRMTTQHQMPAMYAAGGTSVANLIATNRLFNLAFPAVRKAFSQNGHDEKSLQERWAELHQPPGKPFAVALGGLDRIVRYRQASSVIGQWAGEGTDIRKKTLVTAGHQGTINWLRNNTAEMLALADSLCQETQAIS